MGGLGGVGSESGALGAGWKPRSQLAELCGILRNRACETKAEKMGRGEGEGRQSVWLEPGCLKGLGVGGAKGTPRGLGSECRLPHLRGMCRT